MKLIEFAIIEKLSTGILFGFNYFRKESEKDYAELNLYLVFVCLHFKFK